MQTVNYDIIVVGSGPAGLTAAIYALRAGKRVLVLEKSAFGGQITHSPKIENYPGYTQISGNELADQMVEQALTLGADVNLEEVTDVQLSEDGSIKTVVTEDGSYTCRSVILATGVKHRLLGVPGEEELIGNGVSFCAVCDGAFYAGQHVAVIGGGNSALQEAILLSEGCSHVTVVQNLDHFTGEAKLVEILTNKPNVTTILGTTVAEMLSRDGELCGIRIQGADGQTRELTCDGVFVAIGLVPANAPFADVAALNDWGYFDSDERCATTTPGIFVAGDCRSKQIRQITTATADGAVAALAACRYLDE
jgi:thioredoxin reductase (NADPH)